MFVKWINRSPFFCCPGGAFSFSGSTVASLLFLRSMTRFCLRERGNAIVYVNGWVVTLNAQRYSTREDVLCRENPWYCR